MKKLLNNNNNLLLNYKEPIFALASGHPASAIAVIRVSGDGCHELVKKVLTVRKIPKDRVQTYTHFINTKSTITPYEIIDDVLVAFYSAPNSYTGQDGVEISCHGGTFIINQIMTVLVELGIRVAQAGEFTKRAYLNGKMDLSSAEGIKELIDATSHQQWQAARQLSSGKLKDQIEHLRQLLIEVSSHLEARIDFPDEQDTSNLSMNLVKNNVNQTIQLIKDLMSTYKSGSVARNGLKVSLIGPPNVGKSTLMNCLLQKDRAIVTSTPGTTRDYIEESCLVNGNLIKLVDTAGIRSNPEEIEAIGVKFSLDLIKQSDLVIFMISPDLFTKYHADLMKLIKDNENVNHIKVLSKADILHQFDYPHKDLISISCKTDQGIEALKQKISKVARSYTDKLNEATCISSLRHYEALKTSLQFLQNFVELESQGELDECLAFEIQEALRALKLIIGEVSTNDILDKIFSEFCIGK